MPAGHVLTRSDLTIKRPGTGIPAFEMESVVGRTLARDVEGDGVVVWEDLA
jgi:sialic acid synthase SpsE